MKSGKVLGNEETEGERKNAKPGLKEGLGDNLDTCVSQVSASLKNRQSGPLARKQQRQLLGGRSVSERRPCAVLLCPLPGV